MKQRTQYFDLLRVLSMCAVVYLHVAAPGLRQSVNPRLWHVSNLLTSLATAAVPIFFMISGALLMRSERTADPRYVLTHRLPRILLPFLLWSGIEIFAAYRQRGAAAAWSMLSSVTSTPVIVPFWFVYAIVPLYLLSPLLKRMTDALSPRLARYLIGLWLVCTILPKTVLDFLPDSLRAHAAAHPTYTLTLLGGFLGYFLLGAFLDRLARPVPKKLLALIAGLDVLLIAFGTWWDTQRLGQYAEQFKSYLSLYVVVLAVCLFLLAREFCAKRTLPEKPLALFSGASYFVYLAHPRAIDLLRRGLTPPGAPLFAFGTITLQLGFYLLVLASALLACWLFASVKPLSYVLTGQRYQTAANLQMLLRRNRH